MIPMQITTAQEQQAHDRRRWGVQNTPCRTKLSKAMEAFLLDKTYQEALDVLADTARVIDPQGPYMQLALGKGERLMNPRPYLPFDWLGIPGCACASAVLAILQSVRCVEGPTGDRWLLAEPLTLRWPVLVSLIGWFMQNGLRMDVTALSGRYPGLTLGLRISVNKYPQPFELEIMQAVAKDRRAKPLATRRAKASLRIEPNTKSKKRTR